MAVALSLILALIAQYGFELLPCELCILQRYPAAAAVGFWLMGELSGKSKLMLSLFLFACLITAAIASYHTGIEQGWWPGPSSCSGNGESTAALSLEALKAQLMSAPIIRCDKPAFELFGITMASGNAIFSYLLAGYAFLSLTPHKEPK
jgi:disulfide bond formation protein DsbB